MDNKEELSASYAEKNSSILLSSMIQKAFEDGFAKGYSKKEEEYLYTHRENKTIYIDLGLPSGTLWSSDYEKEDNDILYLPLDKANRFCIPTVENWKELMSLCKWEYEYDIKPYTKDGKHSTCALNKAHCTGPNGNKITFSCQGRDWEGKLRDKVFNVLFWLYNEITEDWPLPQCAEISAHSNLQDACPGVSKENRNYHLPLRLVRIMQKL